MFLCAFLVLVCPISRASRLYWKLITVKFIFTCWAFLLYTFCRVLVLTHSYPLLFTQRGVQCDTCILPRVNLQFNRKITFSLCSSWRHVGEMRFWLHIYIFDRKIESILNELKNIFSIFVYILMCCARVHECYVCGRIVWSELGNNTVASVWRRGCKALRFLILGTRYSLTACTVSAP